MILDRRRALLEPLAAFATYALLAETAAASATMSSRLGARRWIARQDELAHALSGGTISQTVWHDEIGRLAREVDVAQLVAEIGRAKLREAAAPFGHDPKKRFVTFLDENGAPMKLAYGAALFSFGRDTVITPHAHKHMASAHMVIQGKVRIRTFDRVRDEEGALIVRPTADHIATVGEAAAMTTAKDNVHWFASRSETAATFDVILDGLDPGEERYLIQPVEIVRGEKRADGTIKAPLISFDESASRYTAAL
jgi:hypothetical protein